ncbi:MAG: hypothetical protein ACRDGR_04115, partial [bacterium]
MKVARTRAFDAVRDGARPVPADELLAYVPIADEDDDEVDLHRLARGDIAPFQRTRVIRSRVTVPA